MLTVKGDVSTASANIVLYGKKVQSGTYNANFQRLSSTTSDGGGNFIIEIEKENISEYKLEVSKYNYFEVEVLFFSSNFVDNIYSENLSLYPSANITITVKNSSPVNANDFFRYTIKSGYYSTIGSCSERSEFEGMDIDEEYDCTVIGSQDVVFEWIKVKNNITTTGSKTVFCNIDTDNFIEFYY